MLVRATWGLLARGNPPKDADRASLRGKLWLRRQVLRLEGGGLPALRGRATGHCEVSDVAGVYYCYQRCFDHLRDLQRRRLRKRAISASTPAEFRQALPTRRHVRSRFPLDVVYATIPFMFLCIRVRGQPYLIPHDPITYASNLVPILHIYFVIPSMRQAPEAERPARTAPAPRRCPQILDGSRAPVPGNDKKSDKEWFRYHLSNGGGTDGRSPLWACFVTVALALALATCTVAPLHVEFSQTCTAQV